MGELQNQLTNGIDELPIEEDYFPMEEDLTTEEKLPTEQIQNMNIWKPLPDNPVLQILSRTGAKFLKVLPKEMACRSCPNSLWMCQQDDLVCFCRATQYVIWQASGPKHTLGALVP